VAHPADQSLETRVHVLQRREKLAGLVGTAQPKPGASRTPSFRFPKNFISRGFRERDKENAGFSSRRLPRIEEGEAQTRRYSDDRFVGMAPFVDSTDQDSLYCWHS
jgi:hypothetical protein